MHRRHADVRFRACLKITKSLRPIPLDAKLGPLRLEVAASDRLAASALGLVGVLFGLMGVGGLAHPRQIGERNLMPLAGDGLCGLPRAQAIYFSRRHLRIYRHERGVIETTRWTSRVLPYNDVESMCFSTRREHERAWRW